MKRVTFFGGAFDPMHMGHYLACAYFLACEPEDDLWIIPSFKHPYDKQMAPFDDRARWCGSVAKLLGPRVSVSTIERDIDGVGRTFTVVQALKAQFPGTAFRMIVGADAYADRAKWFMAQQLEEAITFFPIGRGDRTTLGHLAMPEVSSTEVRGRLARGESCEGLVPAEVLADVLRSKNYK
jgi:nicotinate-nucleotide adenylyltransferase